MPLGDSSDVVVGEPVAAIGSPFGQESSLSVGVVSATERSIDSITSGFNLVDAIQTDAPINRGNSGGPMFDADGDVIGINAQIRSESGTAEGVGFAVPINAARRSMDQLIQTGKVRYAWLGVTTQTRDAANRRAVRPPAEPRARPSSRSPTAAPPTRPGFAAASDETGVRRASRSAREAISSSRSTASRCDSAEDVVRAVNQQRFPGDEIRLTVLRGSRAPRADRDARRPAGEPAGAGLLAP